MIGRLFRPAPRKNVNELGAIADTKLNPILGKVVEYVSDKVRTRKTKAVLLFRFYLRSFSI